MRNLVKLLAGLVSVAVRAPGDVWAVGSTEESGAVFHPLIQRWNGKRWIREAGPLAPETSGQYNSIDVERDGHLWLTGWTEAGEDSENFVYRRAAGEWQQITTKGLEHISYVWKLVPRSGDDVWAVGIGGIAHFDGSRWTRAELPGDTGPRALNIQDLVVRGSNDIWAVGHRPDDELWRKPLVLHYDGSTWSEVPAPADTAQLHSIQFVNGEAIALGENPQTTETYVLVQNGNSFVRAADPPGAGSLYDSVLSGGRIWAVGVAAPGAGGEPDPYVASAKAGR